MNKIKQNMKVWWIPQVPGTAFEVSVDTVQEGVRIMNLLADYDNFQYKHSIKPDYCNAGGIQVLDTNDLTDGPLGSWVDWDDPETGEDDPYVYVKEAADE